MSSFEAEFNPSQFLADPQSLFTQPVAVQLAVTNSVESPRALIEVLERSDNSAVAQAARLHINGSANQSGEWQDVLNDTLVSVYIGQNDRLAVELLKIAPVPPAFLSDWVPTKFLIKGMESPHMPMRYRLQILERLVQEPEIEPRLTVAESPFAPLQFIELLVGDLDAAVRLAAKSNARCSSDLAQQVDRDYSAAADWNTAPNQLSELAQSQWPWVRLAVARNPHTPAETLVDLATDKSLIQLTVAKNPMATAEALSLLTTHADKSVRTALAEHPNATEDILLQILPEQELLILQRKDLTGSLLQKLFDDGVAQGIESFRRKYYLFFGQAQTPEPVLMGLVEWHAQYLDYRRENERFVPNTPEQAERWVNDRSGDLTRIVRHPNVSERILEVLLEHPNPAVRLAIVCHPLLDSNLKAESREMFINPENSTVDSRLSERSAIAGDANTPVEILRQMAEEEMYQPKLLNELCRVIASEYPPKSEHPRYESIADLLLSEMKYEILSPAGLSVDVERWMEIAASPDLLAALSAQSGERSQGMTSYHSQWPARLAFRFSSLFPELSEEALSQLGEQFCKVLVEANFNVKYNSFNHSVGIALVGNPNTPSSLREQLIEQLRQPNRSLDSDHNDCELLCAIAFNSDIAASERNCYSAELISSRKGRQRLVRDSRTSAAILSDILEQVEKGEDTREYNKIKEALAKNPSTPASIIRRIVEGGSDYLWRTVAEQAHTPADVLVKILNENPKTQNVHSSTPRSSYVLKNPNLPKLERYRFLLTEEINKEQAKANELLARRPKSPFALAEVVGSDDTQAKITAARSVNTPTSVLELLARDANERVRRTVMQNRSLSDAARLAMADDPQVNIRQALAAGQRREPTSAELLRKLSTDCAEPVRMEVAKNSSTPVDVLTQLADDPNNQVQRAVAGNPNTPESVLTRLGLENDIIEHRNPNTPGMVLAHALNLMKKRHRLCNERREPLAEFLKHPVKGTRMPPEALDSLIDHRLDSVRYRLAQHPNTSVGALEILSRDTYIPTVRAVADNPNTPAHILASLASTPDLTTRLSVVRNPNTPASVLLQIVLDSQLARNAPNRTVDGLKSAFPGDQYTLLIEIARKPETPLAALEILARREFVTPPPEDQAFLPSRSDDDVVRALAFNPSLSTELIALLIQDPCEDVRRNLLRHRNMTAELECCLAEDSSPVVRQALAASTDTSQVALAKLEQDNDIEVRRTLSANLRTPANSLTALARDTDVLVRKAIASNQATPVNVLEALAADDKVEVRRAIANNSNTPESVRQSLSSLIVIPPEPAGLTPTLRGLPHLYNPQTDDLIETINTYSRADNAFVRFTALLHPLIADEILEEGANSPAWIERYAVAENIKTSPALLARLAQDANWIVRSAANQREGSAVR